MYVNARLALAAAIASRFGILIICVPLLTRIGICKPLPHAHQLLIAWGGVRGPVTHTLALCVARESALSLETRHFAATMATGFVVLNLLCNGLTPGRLGQWLGVVGPARQRTTYTDALASAQPASTIPHLNGDPREVSSAYRAGAPGTARTRAGVRDKRYGTFRIGQNAPLASRATLSTSARKSPSSVNSSTRATGTALTPAFASAATADARESEPHRSRLALAASAATSKRSSLSSHT